MTCLDASTAFIQGFAAAVGAMARIGQPTIAVSLMNGYGLTISDLMDADVEVFDLEPIRAAMQRSNRLSA